MEIMVANKDFNLNSHKSTPYATASSTPDRFGGYFFSAPTSPEHLSQFYRDYDDFFVEDSKSCYEIPIEFDQNSVSQEFFDDGFAFDVSGELEMKTLPAEELFYRGKIKPLKTPTTLENDKTPSTTEKERGRERNISTLSLGSSRRRTQSVSPHRVSKYPWEEKEEELIQNKSTKRGSKKWRLKDFFLFRSASEGRVSDKDPLRKYTFFFWKNDEKKLSRNRRNEGESGSKRRATQVSAHELHYTKNRAVSEDLKKKSFLPYKQGILGKLSFNPAAHALSNGFGFSKKRV